MLEEERVREGGVGVGLGFVVVGGVGGLGIAAILTAAEGGDLKEVEEARMVLLDGELDGRRELRGVVG